VPGVQDFLVLHVDPTPPAVAFQGSLQFASTPLNVRMNVESRGSEEHHFDAPLEVVLTTRPAARATSDVQNNAWRTIQQLDAPGGPPASWQTVTGAHGSVHIYASPLAVRTRQLDHRSPARAARNFAGTVANDGLTLRWARNGE